KSDSKSRHQRIKNSKIRYKDAKGMLKSTSGLMEIQPLIRSHNQEAAICRHGKKTIQDLSFTTVYSYIVSIPIKNHSEVFFEVIKGPPCMYPSSSMKVKFPLSEKEKEFLNTNYPK
ncbi:MAG: hypothetical protein ACFFAE_22140, partial [Candidatus Hodarchaeota archaeon]